MRFEPSTYQDTPTKKLRAMLPKLEAAATKEENKNGPLCGPHTARNKLKLARWELARRTINGDP